MTGTDTEAAAEPVVIGGVDSHADTLHVAGVTDHGGQLADAEFPTTAAGYTAALAFVAPGHRGPAPRPAGHLHRSRADTHHRPSRAPGAQPVCP
ncbi:hypothetical protein V1460_18120 [Streptomyces sp. SCSIO 30461]|uniref:hypothetical protein n=1 Tax=Streptomyces sp. SCSIO 30461 TaxID=3118085 RepID=UPI0030D27D82